MPILIAMWALPLLANSYQYTDNTGTIQVVESKDEVPPRYRRSMKIVSEDSHSAIDVRVDAKADDGLDVQEVIGDALAKQKAKGDKIVTFEALAKKKGEQPPTVEAVKAKAKAQADRASGKPSGPKPKAEAPAPSWTGYIPLLAGIALAFIGLVKLRGFMRLSSICLGLVLTLFGFARAFPESGAAKKMTAKAEEIVEKTGAKETLESAQETVSKPFKAPLEVVGKTKEALRQAEESQKAKIRALDQLTEDD